MATNQKTTVKAKSLEAPTKKLLKPTLTAAERKAKRNESLMAKEAENARRAAEFEKQRKTTWLTLWAKAMWLELLTQSNPEFKEHHSWWFDAFSVSPQKQTFFCDNAWATVSELELTEAQASRVDRSLDTGVELYQEYIEEQQRQKKEAEEKQVRREKALAKLTLEERKDLGLY